MRADIERFVEQWFGLASSETLPTRIPQHGRQHLAMLYRELRFTRGAEIGVSKGGHAQVMCQAVPGLELLCVDPWAPQEGYFDRRNDPDSMATCYREAQRILAPYQCIFVRHPSVIGATLVPDKSLDFVYIDANHRAEFVRQDLEAWRPKVKSGGILAGHDYDDHPVPKRHVEVKAAVDAYTTAHEIQPWFVLLGVPGDKMPSYFWVVE